MAKQSKPNSDRPVLQSIWCIPALSEPVVGVISRYRADGRTWTHVLRWHLGEAPEPGAWATLRLVRHRCFLDPSGEYLCYHGKREHVAWDDPRPEHFRSANAGGNAVSRLPWLSALTHVQGCGPMHTGGGRSKHALSAPERWALWSLFAGVHDAEEPWFLVQQGADAGWRVMEFGEVELPDDAHLAWRAVQERHGCVGRLIVRLPSERWLKADLPKQIEYFLQAEDGVVHPLPGIAWAHMDTSGVLRTASKDGLLSEWGSGKRVKTAPRGAIVRGALAPTLPSSGWKCQGTYDISSLEPRPGPAPARAHASLMRTWLNKMLARATAKDRAAIESDDVD